VNKAEKQQTSLPASGLVTGEFILVLWKQNSSELSSYEFKILLVLCSSSTMNGESYVQRFVKSVIVAA
jgi:hypothetical protein